MQVVALRVLMSSAVLAVYLLINDRSKLKIFLKDIPLFLGTGVCSIVFFNFCYFKAIEITGGASVPALLLYTAPVFVMIISMILFREKITGKKLLALVMTFSGLVLITGVFSGNERLSWRVVLLGLGSGLGYALYSIFGKYLVPRYDSLTITAYTFITASLFAVPMSGLAGKLPVLVSADCILHGMLLTVISTVLPYLLYTRGLAKTEAGKASVLATIEPFAAAVVGIVFFHEKISFMKAAGMILILSAVIFLNTGGKSARKPQK